MGLEHCAGCSEGDCAQTSGRGERPQAQGAGISSAAPAAPAGVSAAVPVVPLAKRRRASATPLEALRDWADEWPAGEIVQGGKIEAKPEDFIHSGGGYAVVACAARLRVSENFVVDHAELLVKETWFADVTYDSWCRNVGVIDDTVKPPHDPINAIKAVLSGQDPTHFTLSLVHLATNYISGYVHCMDQNDEQKLSISHLKVDSAHQGKGLGAMLMQPLSQARLEVRHHRTLPTQTQRMAFAIFVWSLPQVTWRCPFKPPGVPRVFNRDLVWKLRFRHHSV